MLLDKKKCNEIQNNTKVWLVTGAAGFIGSHLVENLLQLEQNVVGLDDLSACGSKNLDILQDILPSNCWERFTFIKGDIRDSDTCVEACKNVDYVLHHAAIGSVPKSIESPAFVDSVNVGGFLTLFTAAAQSKVKRFVYASSSAVYGDNISNKLNKEEQPVSLKSPYAIGKYSNELYAHILGKYYGMETIGLRYFNIYGVRQDPNGAYAAIIPKWIDALMNNRSVEIYGDGKTVRDFCYVNDVVQANIIAATINNKNAINTVYNIASGQKTSLNELFFILKKHITSDKEPVYKPFRAADIRVSQADIEKAMKKLAFRPTFTLEDGLKDIIQRYQDNI